MPANDNALLSAAGVVSDPRRDLVVVFVHWSGDREIQVTLYNCPSKLRLCRIYLQQQICLEGNVM